MFHAASYFQCCPVFIGRAKVTSVRVCKVHPATLIWAGQANKVINTPAVLLLMPQISKFYDSNEQEQLKIILPTLHWCNYILLDMFFIKFFKVL